jgi:beta-galactosidase
MGSAGQRGALSILLASVWLKGAVVAVSPPRRGVVGEAERATVSLPAAASPPAPLSFALNNTINSRTRSVISADARALYVDGEPWYPVSGEIHYARVPAAQWEEALLRMKAGGVDTLSVYVFWIHHEELEGQFDFSGRRDIRQFIHDDCARGNR